MQSEVLVVVVIISISRRFGETSLKYIPAYMSPYTQKMDAFTPCLHYSDSSVHLHGNNSSLRTAGNPYVVSLNAAL